MSDSVRPHRRQPTRLHRPWDSPGKNTGVGCHVLLQSMKVKSESEVVQSYPTLSDPMDYSPPGFSIHGIFQERVLEWGVIAFLMQRDDSLEKTLMLGKIEGKSRRQQQRIRWLDSVADSTDMNLSKSPEIGNGTPLQYSCLRNPMGGGAWWAAVYGVAQSRT